MRWFTVSAAVALGMSAGVSAGQTPTGPAEPQTSPEAAYEQALRPVEITRRSIENWSDIETTALAVAIKQAQTACASRPAAMYTGEALVDLARLCSLGQQWPQVLDAAERYLKDTGAAGQGTRPVAQSTVPAGQSTVPAGQNTGAATRAFAYEIDASLHLNAWATALVAAEQLLRTEPYTATAQAATDELLRYLQLIETSKAIDLAAERQKHLLAVLRDGSPKAVDGEALRLHELYQSALVLPALLQLDNAGRAADAATSEIESSLPHDPPADEALQIANLRRQYALLGTRLPPILATLSLFGAANETPRINTQYGAVTVLLVFPEWCAQCVRMGKQFMPFLGRHVDDDVHLYGLLAGAKPLGLVPSATPARRPRPPPAATHGAASPNLSPKSAAETLRGTPTLVVDVELPSRMFAATDYPLLVATDHDGRIRFLQVAPENAFAEGSLMDQLVTHIATLWPSAAERGTAKSR